jgi:hypothetical protein
MFPAAINCHRGCCLTIGLEMRTTGTKTFKVEGSRGEFYVSTSGIFCVPSACNNQNQYTHSLSTFAMDNYLRLLQITRFQYQPRNTTYSYGSSLLIKGHRERPSPNSPQLNMDLQRSPSTTFQIRPDGVVEMPTWGARLMFAFLAYTPYSWKDILTRLKMLQPFAEQLDEYSLVYSFCIALNTRDSVLLSLISYDPATDRFKLPAEIESLYNGYATPWSFWERPAGHDFKRQVSNLLLSLAQNQSTISEWRARRDWREFCRLVDNYSWTPTSVSNSPSHGTYRTLTLSVGY